MLRRRYLVVVVDEPRKQVLMLLVRPLELGEVGDVVWRPHRNAVNVLAELGDQRAVLRLPINGQEQELLVPYQRESQRAPELLLAIDVGRETESVIRGKVLAAIIVMGAAVDVVGPGLGDDVDEAAAAAPELGGSALGHHDDLLDRIQVEGEGGPLAAALLTEEGVVEVRAVDGDVVGDALLAVDRELVAVGSLHDADPGRELGELEEVPAVVGEPADGGVVDAVGALGPRRLDQRRRRGHHHLLLHRRHLEREGQVYRLAHREVDALADEGGEARHAHGDAVGAEGQQQPAEAAVRVRAGRALEVGGRVLDGHPRPGHRGAALVQHGALDDARRGLRLGAGGHGREDDREQQDEGRPGNTREPRHDIHSLPPPDAGRQTVSLVARL